MVSLVVPAVSVEIAELKARNQMAQKLIVLHILNENSMRTLMNDIAE